MARNNPTDRFQLKADESPKPSAPKTRLLIAIVTVLAFAAATVAYLGARSNAQPRSQRPGREMPAGFDSQIEANGRDMLARGRDIFRFDTFGDEAYWSDKLKLHQAIEGSKFGGVGGGVSPKTALAVGLKVDMDALPLVISAAARTW